jgi:transposase
MLYIKQLTVEEIITLEEMHKNHPLHLSRGRAHSILLSYAGYSIPMICSIYNVCRQTVSTWFSKWDTQGIRGLIDLPGRGRPFILTEEQKIIALDHIKESPRSLNKVISDLEKEFDMSLSIDILKSICKSAGLIWKRVRKSLRSKRDQIKFDVATEEIKELIQQHKNGLINLCYFDQSGFSLEPCVPYAWQPINETIEIPSSKSKRLNVLGFVNRDCEFESFVFEGTITSAVVVESFNWFADQIKKPTILIIDNASIHTSDEFNSNIEDWKKKGLTIYHLPPYSPELNVIEMVWRKIKYDWLPFDAYKSFADLKRELFDVLANIGISYKMEFS